MQKCKWKMRLFIIFSGSDYFTWLAHTRRLKLIGKSSKSALKIVSRPLQRRGTQCVKSNKQSDCIIVRDMACQKRRAPIKSMHCRIQARMMKFGRGWKFNFVNASDACHLWYQSPGHFYYVRNNRGQSTTPIKSILYYEVFCKKNIKLYRSAKAIS